MSEFKPLPSLPAPVSTTGPIAWLRMNLFSSPLNSLLTLLVAYLLYVTVVPALDWAVFSANFIGSSKDACTGEGACWAFIGSRLNIFTYGSYPAEQYWRLNICFALLILSFGPQFFDKFPYKLPLAVFSLTVFPVISYILIAGGVFGLEHVETEKWGGLALTLMLAYVGIVAALPFGVVLALGRRSTMPVIRTICVVFIEFWRGVPPLLASGCSRMVSSRP